MEAVSLKKLLEKELLGKVPLFFSKLSVFNKESVAKDTATRKSTARRILTVPKYQTDTHIVGYGQTKPIGKIVDFSFSYKSNVK